MARSTEFMRRADRWLGQAAAMFPTVFNRRRPLPEAPKRIGVIQPTAIGDTLIASGAVAAIHRRYPQARILMFHGKNNGAAVRMLPTPVEPIACSFGDPFRALAALRAADLDLIVDQTPWPNLTALCARLAAPVTVGFVPQGSPRGRFFDLTVPHRTDRHECENHAEVAALFGAEPPYRMAAVASPCALVGELPLQRLILCHMSAGGARAEQKAWPVRHWAELSQRLVEAGFVVGFTGVAADAALVEQVRAAAELPDNRLISLCGVVPLGELGDLLRRVRLLITVDTGVLHLASAVNAPVLSLHGPTRADRWGPWASNGYGLDSPHPAAGYITYGFEDPVGGAAVMEAVSVEAVTEAVFTRLRRAAA